MPRRPPRTTLLALACAAVPVLGLGCGGSDGSGTGAALQVVATTTQIADFARNVGGDRVAVAQLLQPNSDPHEYEPTPSDVQRVTDADVILEHGLHLDEWLDELIDNAGGEAARTIVSERIAALPGDDESPDGDPHVWLDPGNAVVMVRNVQDALSTADPEGTATFAAAADAYIAQIEALDDELAEDIANVPPPRRKIVTDHDAFGYFARRYGIDVVGTVLPSLSTAAEPSARDLAELADTIRREGVAVIFTEASIDPRLERALASEAGIRIGEPLYGDALGPADSPAGTYLGMMRSNMDAIVAGITPG